MPAAAAADVRPAAWDEIYVLYDDGVYSAIWGRFRRRRFKQIGVRWNEGDNPGGNGYPTLGPYAVWYVEPPFLSVALLLGLREKLLATPALTNQIEALDQVQRALQEARRQAEQGCAVKGAAGTTPEEACT